MAGYNMLTKRAPAKSRRDTRLSWNSHIDNNISKPAFNYAYDTMTFQTKYLMHCLLLITGILYRLRFYKYKEHAKLKWTLCSNCAEVDFPDRLLMTNNLPLTIRRKYSEIVNFGGCLYVRYYVDANDFDPLVMILISDCITPVGFNRIISI